jgi:hypothetical protein
MLPIRPSTRNAQQGDLERHLSDLKSQLESIVLLVDTKDTSLPALKHFITQLDPEEEPCGFASRMVSGDFLAFLAFRNAVLYESCRHTQLPSSGATWAALMASILDNLRLKKVRRSQRADTIAALQRSISEIQTTCVILDA